MTSSVTLEVVRFMGFNPGVSSSEFDDLQFMISDTCCNYNAVFFFEE